MGRFNLWLERDRAISQKMQAIDAKFREEASRPGWGYMTGWSGSDYREKHDQVAAVHDNGMIRGQALELMHDLAAHAGWKFHRLDGTAMKELCDFLLEHMRGRCEEFYDDFAKSLVFSKTSCKPS